MAGGKTREIKRRISSVKNTHQITKAMDIVSSTKFKKFNKIVFTNKENKLCYKLTDDEQTVLLSFNNKSI